MILTTSELREYITTEESNDVLKARLTGVELLIRAYTNNNFQVRCFRRVANLHDGVFSVKAPIPFSVGDTLQITESDTMPDCLVTVDEVTESGFTVDESVVDDDYILVTKVVYPMDVKMGAVNMMKWELSNREKVGVASETISRHSVTYFSMDGENTIMGYPRSLMGFLKPYMKARFGRGIKV